MGAQKGQNNFKAHQAKVVASNLQKLRRALVLLPRRTRYADLNALSQAVALAAGIHPTTLSRNARYLKELWAHVQAHPTIIVEGFEENAQAPALKVRAVEAEIDAASLRRDNARLRKVVERLGARDDATVLPQPAPANSGEVEKAFALTATVLARVLNRLADKELGIVLDARRGEILDSAEDGPNGVIAGRPDTTPFLDWMRRQRTARQITQEKDN